MSTSQIKRFDGSIRQETIGHVRIDAKNAGEYFGTHALYSIASKGSSSRAK